MDERDEVLAKLNEMSGDLAEIRGRLHDLSEQIRLLMAQLKKRS
jgi:hypothetical protein